MDQPTAIGFKVPTELMQQILTLIGELPGKLTYGCMKAIEACEPLYDRAGVIDPPQPPDLPNDEE